MLTEIKQQITAKIAEYETSKEAARKRGNIQMQMMCLNHIIGLEEALAIVMKTEIDNLKEILK